MRELIWKILQTSAVKAYSLVAGVIILALTARWLGPEGRGQVVTILAWVTLFSTIGHFSLGQVAIHRAVTSKDQSWLGSVYGSLLFLAVGSTLICWGVAAFAYILSGGDFFQPLTGWLLAIAFLALPLYIWEQYGSSLLFALNRVSTYNKYQIFGRTTALICLVIFVSWLGMGVAGAVIATIIGQLIIALGGIRILFQQSDSEVAASKGEVLSLLKGGIKLHWNAIGAITFGTLDVLIINHYMGASSAGYYQLAAQLVSILFLVPQAAAAILYGKIASLGPDLAWPFHRRILIYTGGFLCLTCVLAWFMAPWIITTIAGNEFDPAVGVFQWLLLAALGMMVSTVMTPQWISRGLFIQASIVTIVVGLSLTISSLLLIPRYGIIGAAWSAVGAYGLALLINIGMIVYCDRRLRIR